MEEKKEKENQNNNTISLKDIGVVIKKDKSQVIKIIQEEPSES
jgi:hypothetical protein